VISVRLARRFLPVMALLAFVPAMLTGCSPKPSKVPVPPPTISQREADDIAQILATSVAADQGGWYATVKVLCESLSVAPGNLLTNGRPSLAHATATEGAYSFTKAGVTWNANVAYFHLDNTSHAVRDTATDYLEAYLRADQGVFTNANGISGTYGYWNNSTSSPADTNSWGLTVFGLGTGADTLEFSGTAEDTCFALVHSTLNTDNPKLWYMGGNTSNFMDFTLKIVRSTVATSPYPAAIPENYIHWVIEADNLNGSPSRTDIYKSILTEAEMTFTGVPPGFGVLTIQDNPGDAVYTYRFKVDLTTGALVRL